MAAVEGRSGTGRVSRPDRDATVSWSAIRRDLGRDACPVPPFRVVTCSGCGRLLQTHVESPEPEAEGKPGMYIYMLTHTQTARSIGDDRGRW